MSPKEKNINDQIKMTALEEYVIISLLRRFAQ